MRFIRLIDWRLIAAMVVMVVVGTLCYNSVSSNMRADSLVRIAEQSAAQSADNARKAAENAEQVRKLRAQLAKQGAKAGKQSRVQRNQIELLVRLLRRNGLDVPSTATRAPAPIYVQRFILPPPTVTPTPEPDAPGKSDDKRNPKTTAKPRVR